MVVDVSLRESAYDRTTFEQVSTARRRDDRVSQLGWSVISRISVRHLQKGLSQIRVAADPCDQLLTRDDRGRGMICRNDGLRRRCGCPNCNCEVAHNARIS